MKTFLLSCEFNMDTSCVEARFTDGTMIAVDCKAVETALDADTWQRSELDYNKYRLSSAAKSKSISKARQNIG